MFDRIKGYFGKKEDLESEEKKDHLTPEDFAEITSQKKTQQIERTIGGMKVKKNENKGHFVAYYDTPHSVMSFKGKPATVVNDRIVLERTMDGENVRQERFNSMNELFSTLMDYQIKDTRFQEVSMDKNLAKNFKEYVEHFIKTSTDEDAMKPVLEEALKVNKEKAAIMRDLIVKEL